jgi:glycosyltransferase involved in cell wall biosynthesis
MKFCFYGSGIYDALIGNPPGGAELQIALIAKALSEKELQVTIIDNQGNGTTSRVGNITVLFTGKSKVKGLRFITEKIPNSFRYLMQARADFYYVRGFSYLYLIAAYVAWQLKAKFIIGLATDIDVLSFKKRFQYVFKTRTSVFNWLKNDLPSSLAGIILSGKADFRLVQHSYQQKALLERNLKSVIFPNIFLPVDKLPDPTISDCFVYVGSLNERKGLSDLKLLIEICNTIKFKIIGQPQGGSASKKTELLKNHPNVQYFGQMPRESVIRQIDFSKGLLNFSKMEGFPNSFLEAWSCGVPVFSLWVDPDGVIEKYNLGKCFHGDLDSMLNFLKTYIPTGSSEKIKAYVTLNHSYEKAADRFLSAISFNQ